MAKSKKGSADRSKDKATAFENVKDQLAYCGLWCGSCSVGNGTLNELSIRCARTVRDYGVNDWGPKEVNYGVLLQGLDTLGKADPCPGCLKGGGRTNCEIRACATEKGISECVDCGRDSSCQNAKITNIMRTGAKRVGMKVKDKVGSREETLRKWKSERLD